MKYFLAQQEKVYARIRGRKIYLLLDYDGTIAPIAPKPELAALSPGTRTLLKKLANHPQCELAIISGRSLDNIKKMVKIPGIIYAGNHGLEVDYRGRRLEFSQDRAFPELVRQIQAGLTRRLKGIKGVLIENKKVTISLHYRLVAGRQRRNVKTIFKKLIKPYQDRRQVMVTAGKMVLEIRPPVKWGKGDFAKWLLPATAWKENKTAVFYFGDDRTDEEVFKVLKGQAYAIIVGKGKRSAAEYYLQSPAEVSKVLTRIANSLED